MNGEEGTLLLLIPFSSSCSCSSSARVWNVPGTNVQRQMKRRAAPWTNSQFHTMEEAFVKCSAEKANVWAAGVFCRVKAMFSK